MIINILLAQKEMVSHGGIKNFYIVLKEELLKLQMKWEMMLI